jgi:predicted NUDIX family phosphoesterase
MNETVSKERLGEKILCFSRDVISKHPIIGGKILIPYNEGLWNDILLNLQYPRRSEAEKDNFCKQLVAYVVIKAGELYLTYKRTKKSEEERLRNKYSLGIGGHINLADLNQLGLHRGNKEPSVEFIIRGVWREIKEEIDIRSRILGDPKLICFINDESNQVGWRHFGLVWLLEIGNPKVLRKGKGIGKIDFRDLSYLKKNSSKFETWSQLLIDYFNELAGK